MQFKFSIGINDRMAGVVSSGKTYNSIRLLREKVHYFTFAFVAPLGANNSYN